MGKRKPGWEPSLTGESGWGGVGGWWWWGVGGCSVCVCEAYLPPATFYLVSVPRSTKSPIYNGDCRGFFIFKLLFLNVKCSVIIQHTSATEQTRALHWLVCGFCFCFLRSRGWHQGLVHATLVLYSGLHPQHLAAGEKL